MSQSLTQPRKHTEKESKALQLRVCGLTLVAGGSCGVSPAVWLQEGEKKNKKKQYNRVMGEQERVRIAICVGRSGAGNAARLATFEYSLTIAANEMASADTVAMMTIGVK